MRRGPLFLAFALASAAVRISAQGSTTSSGTDAESFVRSGEAALARDDVQAAERAYERASALAPGLASVLRGRCLVSALSTRTEEAEALCRAAVAADPSASTRCALAEVLVAQSNGLVEAEHLADLLEAQAPAGACWRAIRLTVAMQREDIDGVRDAVKEFDAPTDDPSHVGTSLLRAAQYLSDPAHHPAPGEVARVLERARVFLQGRPVALQMVVQQASRNGATSVAERALADLLAAAPRDPRAHLFAAALADDHGDERAAERELDQARALGLDANMYVQLKQDLKAHYPWYRNWKKALVVVIVLWILVFSLLYGVGTFLSSRTLRQVERLDFSHRQRWLYRAVLYGACAFYYVSLPIVALATWAVLVGLVSAPSFPIFWALAALAAACVTTWSLFRSVVLPSRDTPPGTQLNLAQEPQLRRVLDEVAAQVGAEPMDTVYVTPDVEIGVLERGSWLRRLTGRHERCLVIGVASLDGMEVLELKSILAHEYGHLSGGDCVHGRFALRVRASMLAAVHGLARGRAATWYNPAWWFLRGFYHVFGHISQGASRMQEVLADRRAAACYGTDAFCNGLRHMVAQSIRFETLAAAELHSLRASSTTASVPNLYERVRSSAGYNIDATRVQEELMRPVSGLDSHPRAADRIAWISALSVVAPANDTKADAWSLFHDQSALERQMTEAMLRAS
jgi:Zn-dependent protease with chaperone function